MTGKEANDALHGKGITTFKNFYQLKYFSTNKMQLILKTNALVGRKTLKGKQFRSA